VILDGGHAVARIGPVEAHADPSGRLARLERVGAIRIGSAAPPLELLRRPAPPVSPAASALGATLDERRSGR
jgi:antitoxin (DNA-binding transcriptional repressor) of toxin-antitoxin stability system